VDETTAISLGPAKKSMAQSDATWAFAAATYALPGPTILSTRGIDSVPYASAATACAPPIRNSPVTPASSAANITVGSGRGQTANTSPTPAVTAGIAVISSDDGSG
jgi:hypothetical protein